MPEVRFNFEFEVLNEEGIPLTTVKSTVVFIDSKNRFPMGAPDFVEKALKQRIDELV